MFFVDWRLTLISLAPFPLIIVAKKMSIPTFYLEHGAAGDWESAQKEWIALSAANLKNIIHKVQKKSSKIKNLIHTHIFYFSSL